MILITLTLIGFKLFMTRDLAAENLALRMQLAVLQRKSTRPKLKTRDRIFWALLSKIWSKWRGALVFVQPETVVGWHRQGFKLFWKFKSRRKGPGTLTGTRTGTGKGVRRGARGVDVVPQN